ncbi:RadC family protein [Epilithonimonas arachidiradicis]|uniref:DNA repair protein RadC n=1 Tax=Epilithonimonas arachidiradicis TaxID=1617282 RepID=A0A420CXY7_9FLAO|nr:DNA repair protein RadC [Epilithonimonas arachidiradicis]RKE83115.1 DNA repair protein RadC [Epilithonimonas arachidiradicis]GGG65065.1 DNA repair protein RadC [Epilithonimonas arachidiradicis]
MSIKSLAEDDRPREKFLLKGKAAVSDSELLAIIMGSGNREESAVELARRILNSVENNWHRLSQLSIKDLMKFKGVGEAKAISIATALEIGNRKSQQEVLERQQISSSKDIFEILQPHLSDLPTEEFWAVFLNHQNKILYKTCLFRGGIASSVADVRIIFKTALEHFSTRIVIAHNHPAGSLKPSQQDITITNKIKDAGKLLEIELLDHIIIAHNKFYSFKEEGIL